MKATTNIKTVWVAAVAYMADTREITNKEVPDYDLSQLLRLVSHPLPHLRQSFHPDFQYLNPKSDIGGAAVLFLGISVGTIIGCIDCVILSILNTLKIYIRRKRVLNFDRRYDNDFRRSSWSSYEQAMIREY